VRVGLDWRPTFSKRGGIPVYVRSLVAAYARRFPADDLLLYGHRLIRRGESAPRTSPPGARLVTGRLPSRAAEALARLGHGADRIVGGCDVFHMTDYAWLGPLRAPMLATVHDVLFDELPRCYTPAMRRGLRHVTRLLVARSARLIVPSVRTKIGLVERYGADPDRVDVVPLAPRALPAAPAADDVPAPRPYLLGVGTIEPRKNWSRALDAHARVLAGGVDLDFVLVGGPGWLEGDLPARLASSPRVRWEASASDARLAALYRGATAFVYPSLGEGFGLPVVEAMAAGVPVLTSAGTACEESAAGAALTVDPYDVEATADAMRRLAGDDALRAALRARGLARAAALTWERTAEGTRASYERAA
jgi:glycosyltransferase involved in cell wall biosynthesis